MTIVAARGGQQTTTTTTHLSYLCCRCKRCWCWCWSDEGDTKIRTTVEIWKLRSPDFLLLLLLPPDIPSSSFGSHFVSKQMMLFCSYCYCHEAVREWVWERERESQVRHFPCDSRNRLVKQIVSLQQKWKFSDEERKRSQKTSFVQFRVKTATTTTTTTSTMMECFRSKKRPDFADSTTTMMTNRMEMIHLQVWLLHCSYGATGTAFLL